MNSLREALEAALSKALRGDIETSPGELAKLLEPVVKSDLRAKYGRWFLWLIAGLDGAVIALIVLVGLGYLKLDSNVLMALVGATVVQSGSITYLIAAYLFPKQ